MLAREQAILVERIINIGRRTAAERLAHFLAEEAGEEIDEAVEDAGDSLEEAADEVEDAADGN